MSAVESILKSPEINDLAQPMMHSTTPSMDLKDKAAYGTILFKKVQTQNCQHSFKELFEYYYNQVIFYSRRYIDSTETSEEIVNDVFLKLWNKRKEIQLKGSFQSYLFSSIRNKCIDAIRKQHDIKFESESSLNGIESDHSNTLEIINSNELYAKIERAINQLPKDRRKVFKMSRTEGLMYKEIAERLNISIKTVETQMGRSLRFLREQFKEELSEFYAT